MLGQNKGAEENSDAQTNTATEASTTRPKQKNGVKGKLRHSGLLITPPDNASSSVVSAFCQLDEVVINASIKCTCRRSGSRQKADKRFRIHAPKEIILKKLGRKYMHDVTEVTVVHKAVTIVAKIWLPLRCLAQVIPKKLLRIEKFPDFKHIKLPIPLSKLKKNKHLWRLATQLDKICIDASFRSQARTGSSLQLHSSRFQSTFSRPPKHICIIPSIHINAFTTSNTQGAASVRPRANQLLPSPEPQNAPLLSISELTSAINESLIPTEGEISPSPDLVLSSPQPQGMSSNLQSSDDGYVCNESHSGGNYFHDSNNSEHVSQIDTSHESQVRRNVDMSSSGVNMSPFLVHEQQSNPSLLEHSELSEIVQSSSEQNVQDEEIYESQSVQHGLISNLEPESYYNIQQRLTLLVRNSGLTLVHHVQASINEIRMFFLPSMLHLHEARRPPPANMKSAPQSFIDHLKSTAISYIPITRTNRAEEAHSTIESSTDNQDQDEETTEISSSLQQQVSTSSDKNSKDNSTSDEIDSFCPICQSSFEEEDLMTVTSCDHTFHLECLIQWLKKRRTCPICRTDLVENQSHQPK